MASSSPTPSSSSQKAKTNGKTKPNKAPPPVDVHFLGTCSGGGPIISRQCSATAVDFGSNIWLFDAADGTNNRLHQSSLRMVNISRIFITHMHADHILGIVAILGVIMSGVGQSPAGLERLRQQGTLKRAEINIYGPAGLRRLIRTMLECTAITLTGAYAVHELIPEGGSPSTGCQAGDLHVNEAQGIDFHPNDQGVWEDIVDDRPSRGIKGWRVSAGPLVHRVPSIGYVLTEPEPRHSLDTGTLIPLLKSNAEALAELDPPIRHPLSLLSRISALPAPPPFKLPSGDILHPPEPTGDPGRKIVIFGDCSGGTPNKAFQKVCEDASLLVHECTNAAIPESVGKGEKGRLVRAAGLEQSLEKKRDHEFEISARDRGVVREPWVFHGKRDNMEKRVAAEDQFAAKKASVRAKAHGRGHAAPEDVGEFASAIRARRVAVNHFSAMFPSPRYVSNDPYPSLLGPVSPFPYPTADITAHAAKLPPMPLTANELHLRLIMQSIANQINADWNGPHCALHNVDEAEPHLVKMAVCSRDFMVFPVPSHELTSAEIQTMAAAHTEANTVLQSWATSGGAWVVEQGRQQWIGVEKEPAPTPAGTPVPPAAVAEAPRATA
ncbi:hypothetical protein VHUM_02736 [Vanrija humicola]|uniref:Metallo-beta-lactamase domain-containing protein n=1 Tax=Vanrija humicola TaxID=5417 RepID=A0A7D8V0U3_VANHU|nr:hypothetical protein VHUM_02736 [Vanrija humicola]